MKKSVNKIALALWVLAILAAVVDVFGTWIGYVTLSRNPDQYRFALDVVSTKAAGAIVQFAWLIGLATLIEIADRIRWDLKNRS